MNLKDSKKNIISRAALKEIIEALDSLKYGYVGITIHNSRIVQIDKTIKTRFDDVATLEKGGGI